MAALIGESRVERRQASDGAPLVFRSNQDAFSRYACSRPLAYALFRAAECDELAALRVPRPVLDVGCGEGEFGVFALASPPDIGVDLLADRLAQARKAARAGTLARADACRLPFGDASFASVLAVSVLEHFERPATALAEIARVLRPGGRFIATIVLSDLHQHLFYPRLLRPVGLDRGYLAAHDRVFKHKSLLPKDDWEKMVSAAGLDVIESRKIVSPAVTRAFDFFLATAWPYRLLQQFGVRFVWRPRWMEGWCWRLFETLVHDGAGDRAEDNEWESGPMNDRNLTTAALRSEAEAEGSTLLMVAEKP